MTDRTALLLRAGTVFGALMEKASLRSFSRSSKASSIQFTLASSAPVVATTASTAQDETLAEMAEVNGLVEKTAEIFEEGNEKSSSYVRSAAEQASIGAVLGFATGFSIRKAAKAAMFLVGTEVVILQYMAYREWLIMDWKRIGRDLAPNFNRSWNGFLNVLLYDLPFSAAFSGGLFAGLKISSPK